MANALTSQFAIDVVIENIANLRTLREAVDNIVALGTKPTTVKLNLDTTEFDQKLKAALARARVEATPGGGPGVGGGGGGTPQPIDPGLTSAIKTLTGKIETLISNLNRPPTVRPYGTTQTSMLQAFNQAGREARRAAEGSGALTRGIDLSSTVPVSRPMLSAGQAQREAIIINKRINEYAAFAAKQQEEALAARAKGKVAQLDEERRQAYAINQRIDNNVKAGRAEDKRRKDEEINQIAQQLKADDKVQSDRSKARVKAATDAARAAATATRQATSAATRAATGANQVIDLDQAVKAYAPTFGGLGFAGGNTRQRVQSFNAVLGRALKGVDNAVQAFENKLAASETAISQSERDLAQRAVASASLTARGRTNVVSRLIQQAHAQGLPLPPGLVDINQQYRGGMLDLLRQQQGLGRLSRAETLAGRTDIGPERQAAAGQLAAQIRAGLAGQGITPDTYEKARANVANLERQVLSGANTWQQYTKEVKAGETGLEKFTARFQQLARFALAGGILFGIIQVLRHNFSQVIQLEAELTRIENILGRTSINDRLLIQDTALEQARKYGIALSGIVETIKNFAQAGFTLRESLKLSQAVAGAVVGGGLTQQQATQTAIAVENVSRGRTSAEDIFGRIAKIERTTAISGEDLALIVQRVGGIATQFQEHQVGAIDAFDTVIGLATTIVERTRVSGATVAAGLRFTLSRLATPRVEQALQNQYGIRLAANREGTELRQLPDILADLAARYKELKAQNRTGEAQALLVQVAGGRQAYQLAAVLDNFSRAMDIAKESAFAFGDIERRTIAQLDTVQSRFGQLANAAVSFANTLLVQSGIIKLLNFGLREGKNALEYGSLHPGTTAGVLGIGALGARALRGLGRAPVAGALTAAEEAAFLGVPAKVGFFARMLAKIGIGGGAAIAETAVVRGAVAAPLILRGLGLVGTALTGTLEIAAAIAAVAAIGELFQNIRKTGEAAKGVKITSLEDIIKGTEFGKEFKATATGAGLSPTGFVTQLSNIVNAANAQLLIDKVPGITPDVIAGRKTSGNYRSAFERAAVAQALSGPNALTGFSDIEPDQRVGVLLEYIKNAAKFIGGPATNALTEIKDRVQSSLDELANAEKSSILNVVPTAGKYGRYGSNSSIEQVRLNVFSSAFKQIEGGFGGALESIRVRTTAAAKPISLLAAAIEQLGKIDPKTHQVIENVGQALDSIFHTYYDTSVAKTPEARLYVETNRRSFINAIGPAVRRAAGIETAADALKTQEQESGQLVGDSGAEFMKFLRESLEKAIKKELAAFKSLDNPIAKALKAQLDSLRDPHNEAAYKLITRELNSGRARARERLIDILANFAKQQEEIAGVKAGFNFAGLPYDEGKAKQSSLEELVKGFAGVRAQIQGDLIRLKLRRAGQTVAQSQLLEAGSDITDESINPRPTKASRDADRQNRALIFGAFSTTELKSLDESIKLTREQLAAVTNNVPLLGKLDPEDRKFLTKYLAIDTAGGTIKQQRAALIEKAAGIKDFERIGNLLLKLQVDENAATEYGNILLKQRNTLELALFDIRKQGQQVAFERAARRAELSGYTYAGLPVRVQGIEAERQAARQRAQLEFQGAKAELDRNARDLGNFGSSQYLNDLLKLQGNVTQQLAVADLQAEQNKTNLIQNERLKLAEQITGNVRAAVESASSGLVNVISSFESLTSGNLIQRIIDPIANEITGGFAKNFKDALVGSQGLLRKAAEDLVGGPARIAGKRAEAELEASILHANLIATAADMGAIIGDAIKTSIGPIGGEPGPPGIPPSDAYGNRVPGSEGAAAAVAAASGGIPDILRGHLDLGRLARGNRTQGSGGLASAVGTTAANNYGIISGASGILNSIPYKDASGKVIPIGQRLNKLLDASLPLIGAYGGAALGGEIFGKGKYSYASEGGALGSAIGSFVGGPVGGLVGGLLGGIVGGIFGKGHPPTPELQVLEKIDRGQKAVISAIENQTRQLLSLDNRLLNVPSSFNFTNYRPINAVGGNSSFAGQPGGAPPLIIQVDARGSTNPAEVENRVIIGVNRGLRSSGTFVTPRY